MNFVERKLVEKNSFIEKNTLEIVSMGQLQCVPTTYATKIEIAAIVCGSFKPLNPYKPTVLFVGHRQTAKTQIMHVNLLHYMYTYYYTK